MIQDRHSITIDAGDTVTNIIGTYSLSQAAVGDGIPNNRRVPGAPASPVVTSGLRGGKIGGPGPCQPGYLLAQVVEGAALTTQLNAFTEAVQ